MPRANTITPGERAGGRAVGGYELLRVLGRGGMATVYLARQPDLDRLVALKELGGLRTAEPSFAQRFVREARVAGALSHPSIVTVHDFFEHDGTPYIAMEYVSGGTLRPQMRGMSVAAIAGVLESVLAGLVHAEGHGIVHRDLKPENLMVTSGGRVKIADFGIAKATGALQTGSFRTETGTTIGTPSYIAPEQAMAEEVGPWTDLYSLGVIAFEMLVGHTPFHDSDTPMAIVLRHINERIPPVSELRPDVDPEVSQWVERLLVKDPSGRTQSAAQAWDEFEDLAIGMLGPRWRDGSLLVGAAQPEDTGAMSMTRTTRALGGTGAMSRTRTTRAIGGGGLPIDEPFGDTAAATVMPRRRPTAAAEPPARRRKPLVLLAVMTFLAVAAAAAAFAGGGGGDGGSPGAAAAPRSSADSMNTVLADLRRSAALDEASLAAASKPAEQSRAATALATDYEAAADRLAGGSHAAVVAALRQVARGYRTAAAAAARGDTAGFNAGGADVAAGQQALDGASGGAPAAAPAPAPTAAPAAPSAPAQSQSQPAASGSGGTSASPASPCAGDSASDDASDDACSPSP